MKRDDNICVSHILDAARKITDFTSGKTRDDLDSDEKLALALVRLFEIMGEAANSVSKEFRTEHPEVPWNKLISMRNRLIHGYFDINYDIVWNTIEKDIPAVVELLIRIP